MVSKSEGMPLFFNLELNNNYGCIHATVLLFSNILKKDKFHRSYYKEHKDKIKGEGRGGGGRWDWLGWGGGMGRKCRQL